jgi:hypothetical protein
LLIFTFVIDNHSQFEKKVKKAQNVEIKTLCHHVLLYCDMAIGIFEVIDQRHSVGLIEGMEIEATIWLQSTQSFAMSGTNG